MKVLLLEDVYNLGKAGEVKKVANGYGRNYLLPQGLAVLATKSALATADRIKADADSRRVTLNSEMGAVADKMKDLVLFFPARAGETGKLYGSVTTQMITEKLAEEINVELDKRQIDSQPLRQLGMHTAKARLTIDIIPEFSVVVYREGESPENYMVAAEELAELAQSAAQGDQQAAAEMEELMEEAAEETEAVEEAEMAEEAPEAGDGEMGEEG